MDTFRKVASLFFLAGSIVWPLIGCSQKSDGQFHTYDHLKKSATQASAEPEHNLSADFAPVTAVSPVQTKVTSTPVAKKIDSRNASQPEPTTAPKSPAVASASSTSGTKVTDAAFQASVSSTNPKSGAVPVSATTAPRK